MWIWFKTGYTINGEKLHIHYGPFKKEINIIEIHSLREMKKIHLLILHYPLIKLK
ncbi:PH domain-containing protein [Cytobacillus horneckiae]|uniref:PH domain-containing protein n=1 Tax=Cytobacillus horneckiae TaxID=549687 RepID=UPI003B8A8512